MNALTSIICHSEEAITVHSQSSILTTFWTVLDDLLTLSKLPPIPERALHLQVELGPGGGVKGGTNIHQVVSINSTMYAM